MSDGYDDFAGRIRAVEVFETANTPMHVASELVEEALRTSGLIRAG